MKNNAWVRFAAAALTLSCCAPPLAERDGFRVLPIATEENVRKVKGLAAFALGCPEQALQARILSVKEDTPDQIGIAGCDKRAVYVKIGNELTGYKWVMNSEAAAR